MAGVVAVAAVIEDFEPTQPCKKMKKDDDLVPPRTITNYFMPLTKVVEKPFSPPRSNKIKDYFQKTLPAQNKVSSVKKCSDIQSTESCSSQEASIKVSGAQKQKRTRKIKPQNKLHEKEVLSDDCAVITESSCESVVRDAGGPSVCGSDTAALLSEISREICSAEESLKCKNSTETNKDEKIIKDVTLQSTVADNICKESKGRTKKPAVKTKRKTKVSHSESCIEDEKKQSLHDASLEVNVDETSVLNCSTITVSFEDFVQSQVNKNEDTTADANSDSCATMPSHDPKCCLEVTDVELAVPQVSPRTLTVQAEVHPISPELVKSPQLRMASIFTRNKKSHMEDDKIITSHQVAADVLPDLKRKSNVVLHEDLELDVVELSSTPKSTQEERKQFMNAFKQPGSDGSKSKTSKASGKSKQDTENTPDTVQPEEKTDASNSDQNQGTDKPVRKTKKSVKKDQTGSSTPEEITPKQDDPTPMELGNETDAVPDSNLSSAKVLRRSTRDPTRKQTASVPNTNPSPRKTRRQEKAEIVSVSEDGVAPASTPKLHRTKSNVYRAEMLSVEDKQGSPIRMKFTRVFPSSITQSEEFEISSPLSAQESNALKKRKRAKKLVQKAKELKQSKQAPAGDPPSVRRSARSKEPVEMNYCENEDSVVFVDDVPSSCGEKSPERKSQKKLRSLHEVLGKTTLSNKANSKIVPANKAAPVFMGRKSAAVISLLDESSRDGSENSQDDEQFRAKREFLKSGLPETFKRQIARTAANREAYAHACASFQSVAHVQQRPTNCSTWALPWPENPFLSCLKDSYNLTSSPLVSLEGRTGHLTVPARRTRREKVSGWREDFTEPIRERLLKELSISNPSFPVQRFFTRFLKKYQEHMQAMGSETECRSKAPIPAAPATSLGGKRKRVDEKSDKLAKKQRSTHTPEEPIVILDGPSLADGGMPNATEPVVSSTGCRRRSQRNKQSEEPLMKMLCDSPIILDSPPSVTSIEPIREDVLWTEKYQPQHSNDIIGNTASVRKLHSWLKEWKLRADREERRKQQEKKQEEDSNDSWFGGDDSGWLEDAEDMLCNTVLITGPTGVGKTAAVYACAQELGFKVFEVNCSSQRSGRQILSQLKEATQSHQVDIQGVNAYKPTYFNSYSSSGGSAKPGSSPRKVNSPRRVVSSPRKPPQSPRGTQKKGGLAPVSLANLFKMSVKPPSKDSGSQDKKTPATAPKKSAKVTQVESKNQETKPSVEDQGKKTATSLILFEEVDVIFDDDSGFLAAIKTFMTTTKRPVILTTSDPAFSTTFDGYFEDIHFQTLPEVDVASYLQLLCLVENVRTDTQDLTRLLHWNKCDLRQSLMHLQFWTRGGQGCQVPRPISLSGPEGDGWTEGVEVKDVDGTLPLSSLPPCHVGCTESWLGLQNIQHEKEGDLFWSNPSAMKSLRSWGLEAETRGVNVLYSNMEVLLPLPIRLLLRPTLGSDSISNPEPQPVPQTSHARVLQEEQCEDSSPVKVSSTMRRKKQLKLDSKNALQSDSESDSDDFLSLPKPSLGIASDQDIRPVQDQIAQKSSAPPVGRRRAEMSEAEKQRSKPVSHCLSTIAEYLDHMSFLDSSLHHEPSLVEGACRPQAFNCSGANIKSGMTDEVCLDSGDHTSGLDVEEIQAVLSSMTFWKCGVQISKTWKEVQEMDDQVRKETVEELTLPVASHRQIFSLCHSTLCEPRVMKLRKEVINTVLTSRSFSSQGNRAAVLMDYLPSLRTICRSERLKEQGRVKRRFMHYFDGIHLDLPKSTLQHLASSFP